MDLGLSLGHSPFDCWWIWFIWWFAFFHSFSTKFWSSFRHLFSFNFFTFFNFIFVQREIWLHFRSMIDLKWFYEFSYIWLIPKVLVHGNKMTAIFISLQIEISLTVLVLYTWEASDIVWIFVLSDIIVDIVSIWVVSDASCHHKWIEWHSWPIKTSESTKRSTTKWWSHFITGTHFWGSNAKNPLCVNFDWVWNRSWTLVQILIKSS